MKNFTNDQIRKSILLEYDRRSKGISSNPEMHMYNFPELKEIDNKEIYQNAKYLIDENLVRGGIDEEGEKNDGFGDGSGANIANGLIVFGD